MEEEKYTKEFREKFLGNIQAKNKSERTMAYTQIEDFWLSKLKAQETKWLETDRVWNKTLNFLKKEKKAHQEAEYQKGFTDGSETTGSQSQEILDCKLKEQRADLLKKIEEYQPNLTFSSRSTDYAKGVADGQAEAKECFKQLFK